MKHYLQVRPELIDAARKAMDEVIANASVVALNFTLQFVEPGERLGLLERIAASLLDGGVLILSEKIRFPDALSQSLQDQWNELADLMERPLFGMNG